MLSTLKEPEKTVNLVLTEDAQKHFSNLIRQEFGTEPVNLRINVEAPGTPKADVGITFCPIGQEQSSDFSLKFKDFVLYIERAAYEALTDAVIHFKADQYGGELFVKAPHIKGKVFDKGAALAARVQYLIDNEINQNLSSHGGYVSLVSIEANNVVVLKFGGGCHGCGMADITLKSGIEKTLREHCPDITEVRDITDHTTGENPYFAASKS